MRFLYDNLPAILIALVASLLAWTFGGTRSDLVLSLVPWLMLLMAETIFIFPQKHANETTPEARERAWGDMKHDPLVWVAVGLIVLMLIPLINDGLCPNCDRAEIALGLSADPPVKFLPFCVDRFDHFNVVLWFMVALSCMVATRHCLTHEGKRTLLELIVWNGLALAVLGFVEAATKAPGPLWTPPAPGARADTYFATFGYPNMGADYFTTIFGLSVALWRWRFDEVTAELNKDSGSKRSRRGWFWKRNYMLIPAFLSFFAVMNTLSRAGMILVSSLAVIFFVHSIISMLAKKSKARRVKLGMIYLAIAGILVFFASMFMPEDIQREVDTLDPRTVCDRVTGRGQYHVRVATELWKDHVLFGCGGWGYKHLCLQKMTEDELKQVQMVGGINVHNDYLQFLAEHGLVGFGAMVAMVVLLLLPVGWVWRSLASAARFAKEKDRPPRPTQLFALPASAFFVLMTALATFIHGFGDCPLRSPAVLTLFFVELAAITGFLPRVTHSERHKHAVEKHDNSQEPTETTKEDKPCSM